jgi:hypothetical protein
MTAAHIAAALGHKRIKAHGSNYLVHCPCHHDREPSLSIRDGDRGLLVNCFAGCDARDVLNALRQRGLLDNGRGEQTPPPPIKGSSGYERQQHDKARWLWSRRRPLVGSLAERYLRQTRGYTGALPATLGFLPALKREHRPALIAAVTHLLDEPEPGVLGQPRNVECVHLTLLNDDGTKAQATRDNPNKRLIGSPLTQDESASHPIVLAPVNDLFGLAMTEGIEDALTAHAALGLGAWAGLSADFMGRLGPVVPSYVEAVTIFGHADKAGIAGARQLAQALRQRGIEVTTEGLDG